jgi:hypothetical protein
VAANEGASLDSLTSYPTIPPDETLFPELEPPAHKPDFIWLLEPRFAEHTNGRRRYSSIKRIQKREWEYCIDHNLSHTTRIIPDKYTPLANAIRQHWPCTDVDILPVVLSRTGTPHTSTIHIFTSLLTVKPCTHDQ